jgi:mono/diheme cytochrome c family protein
MKRALRWIGIALAGLVGLALLAYAVVYFLSERALQRKYPVPAVALSIPSDPESIKEGERLATVRGCFPGCHGKKGEGAVMFDEPIVARIVAPNLSAAAKKYSGPELAGILRNGVRPDGRSMLVMPSQTYAALSDQDLARIVAYLKSLPEIPGPGASISPGPIGRLGLTIGKFKVAAQHILDDAPPPPAKSEDGKQGRYLAQTICSECHGSALQGDANPSFTSPGMRVVMAYSPEAFTRLLRTGIAVGERTVGEMTTQSKNNLSHLTDAEIAALYGYLRSLP